MNIKISINGPVDDPTMGRGFILDLFMEVGEKSQSDSFAVKGENLHLALDTIFNKAKLMYDFLSK